MQGPGGLASAAAIGGAERDDDLAASIADVSAAAGDADGHAFRHAPQLPRVGRQVGGDHGDDAALVGVVVHLVLGLGQQPSDRPAGSTLHLEVTNNPFDTNPVWEDITEKANRLVHTFTNSTVANGYGLGYRFYLLKGTEEIEITQATIRFA